MRSNLGTWCRLRVEAALPNVRLNFWCGSPTGNHPVAQQTLVEHYDIQERGKSAVMGLDTYDSGSERWFQLAMVQLGPVYFLKERMSQDGMLATLRQAAQAHSGVLGHELRERGRKRVDHSVIYHKYITDGGHPLWQGSPVRLLG